MQFNKISNPLHFKKKIHSSHASLTHTTYQKKRTNIALGEIKNLSLIRIKYQHRTAFLLVYPLLEFMFLELY